jgi:hypothetical protein
MRPSGIRRGAVLGGAAGIGGRCCIGCCGGGVFGKAGTRGGVVGTVPARRGCAGAVDENGGGTADCLGCAATGCPIGRPVIGTFGFCRGGVLVLTGSIPCGKAASDAMLALLPGAGAGAGTGPRCGPCLGSVPILACWAEGAVEGCPGAKGWPPPLEAAGAGGFTCTSGCPIWPGTSGAGGIGGTGRPDGGSCVATPGGAWRGGAAIVCALKPHLLQK